MNIQYSLDKEPVKGVSLIKVLSIDMVKPFHINEIFVKPYSKTPVDKHQVSEFWHVLSGKGKLFYKNQEYTLNMGDWFFFYPYEEHQVENPSNTELKILSIYWK